MVFCPFNCHTQCLRSFKVPETQFLEGTWKLHHLGLGSMQRISTLGQYSVQLAQLRSATGLWPQILRVHFQPSELRLVYPITPKSAWDQ